MLQSLPPVPAIVRAIGDVPPARAEIPLPDESPKYWPLSPVQGVHIGDLYAGDQIRAIRPDSESVGRHETVCGVITIVNSADWMPKNTKAVPPSMTNKFGMYLSAQWAMLFNSSGIARRKRLWALVTCRGNVIILADVPPEDRPADPAGFPRSVIDGLTTDAADQLASGANQWRCEHEGNPRLWTIAVRRADTVQPDSEGEVSTC